MRKIMICVLCMLLAFGTAQAGGLAGLLSGTQRNALPDPEPHLTGGATFYDGYFELAEDFRGVAYAYPMPENWTLFLMEYTALCEEAGYTIEKGRQLNQPAWQVESGGKSAWLIPEYKGSLLVVVDRDIPFAPIPTPEPTATPRPTAVPKPTAVPTSVPRGHWEYSVTQQDCFACVGGVCNLCGGTTDGGLNGLIGTTTLLPDPCLALDDSDMVGKLYQADYQFSADYLCDAYIYPYLGRGFVSDYTGILKNFGYTISKTKVDGVDGYSIQRGDGLEALLVLDFNGQTLFLVEKGMDFVLTNVMTCVYNGSETEAYLWLKSTPQKYVLSKSRGMTFKSVNAKFDSLDFEIPDYAVAGDVFEIMSTSDYFEELKLTLWPKTGNPVTLLHDDITFRRTDKIKTNRDHVTFEIIRLEETSLGTLLVGTFEGSFDGGKYQFENGQFSAMVNDW